MTAELHVTAVLRLLDGLQSGHLMATSVELTDEHVKLEGIAQHDPIRVHPGTDDPRWRGDGEAP